MRGIKFVGDAFAAAPPQLGREEKGARGPNLQLSDQNNTKKKRSGNQDISLSCIRQNLLHNSPPIPILSELPAWLASKPCSRDILTCIDELSPSSSCCAPDREGHRRLVETRTLNDARCVGEWLESGRGPMWIVEAPLFFLAGWSE